MNHIMKFNTHDYKVKELCKKDPLLGELILLIGDLELTLRKDYYCSLVKNIIGQQLSSKTTQTIFSKLEFSSDSIEPESINRIKDEELRNVGISVAKVNYIRDLTKKILTEELQLSCISNLTNDEIIFELTKVKGIGKWTAEMFLIFSLGRLNVLSYGDISIRNSIKWLYGIDKEANFDLNLFYEKWSPYNTIASLYLWEAIDRGYTKNKVNQIL